MVFDKYKIIWDDSDDDGVDSDDIEGILCGREDSESDSDSDDDDGVNSDDIEGILCGSEDSESDSD